MGWLQGASVHEEDLHVVRRSLQRALEVLEPMSETWTRCVRSLGVTYAKLADRTADTDRHCAIRAARVALAAFERLGMEAEIAAAEHLLGVQLLRSGDVGIDTLREAVAVLEDAARRTSLDASPIEWCEIVLSLADACFDLDAFGERGAARAGTRLYETVLDVVTQNERLQRDPATSARASGLVTIATERLTAIDRAAITMPVLPDGWEDRPVRGAALYLRPLATAGEVLLRNRFDAARFAVRFETEPDRISLESALYRALGPSYSFQSIGGRADGLGMTRAWIVGGEGWADIVDEMLPRARLIVMVPSRSDGVRWEIERLIGLDALPRTLFCFPPEDGGEEVAALVDGARLLLADLGVGVPDHDPDGLWFRSDADGNVIDVIPFDALWDGTLPDRLSQA
jgi:hypothetical protein